VIRHYPLFWFRQLVETGSEGNGFAVLTNPENGDKKSLRCNAIVAKASIIDSECMMTMPKGTLASVGFDAFCHCMEAYISKIRTAPNRYDEPLRYGAAGKTISFRYTRAKATRKAGMQSALQAPWAEW